MFTDALKRFREQQDGAITVDWIVLTAAIIGLGLICLGIFTTASSGTSNTISNELGKIEARVANGTVLEGKKP